MRLIRCARNGTSIDTSRKRDSCSAPTNTGSRCSASASTIMVSCAPGAKASTASAGPYRHQHGQRQHRECRNRHRDRKRSQRRAEEAEQRIRIGVGKSRAGDRTDADHRRIGHPPRQDRVDKSAAVQDRGRQHGAEHQPARQPQLEKHKPRAVRCRDQDDKFHNRRRTGGDEACHQAAALDGQPEVGQPGRNAQRQCHHPHGLHDGDGAEIRLVLGRQASSPGRARRGLRRTAPTARPSRARSAGKSWSP